MKNASSGEKNHRVVFVTYFRAVHISKAESTAKKGEGSWTYTILKNLFKIDVRGIF